MPLLRLEEVADVFPGVVDLPSRAAPSTVHQYVRDCLLYLAFCHYDVDQARDPARLRAWRQWMVQATQLSPNTINRRLAAIKTLAKLSATPGGLDALQVGQFHLVEPVTVRALKHRLSAHAQTWLEPADVRALWRVSDPTTLIGLRNRALIALMASSGIRVSEAAALHQAQLHWQGAQGYLEVVGKRRTEPRLAPLTAEAWQWVQRWLQARAAAGVDVPHVFTQFAEGGTVLTATPLNRHGAYAVIKRCAKKAGLTWCKPHDLRRFVGNRLAETDIRQAQLALGHQHIATTERYVRGVQRVLGMTENLW